ncbi:hypothetical protein Tco_1144383 [Tanacetum coccineum]
MEYVKKSIDERTQHKREYDSRMNERQMQSKEGKVDSSKALDASLVVTECSGTKSDKRDTKSSSGNCITHVVDADIRPVNDQVSFAEVQLTAQHNVLANEQQHSVQSKPSYDTHLLEKVDRNITPDLTKCVTWEERLTRMLKNVNNKAKIKKEIEVLETINIELEHSVAKLLAENEKLHKENEHLKQTYKDLYVSIKNTRVQTKDHNDSLIAQINSKTIENADLKAQIQEKVIAILALKNELRKLKVNSVDTKFAKPSILGKPVLQPPTNQSVVRQLNAFKSERPNFSKPRFASQVKVNKVLSKPATPHFLPKVREFVLAKPHHVIAPGSYRNSQEELYGLNDMAHNYCLEEARKKTQERNKNSKSSVMHTTSHKTLLTVQSTKTRNSNKPVESTSHTQKPGRQIITGHRFSSNKSSTVHEKTTTPRSCLRWIPTGKIFSSSTTKVDCEPPNGSNEDITNLYECDQNLNVGAGTLNLSVDNTLGPAPQRKERNGYQEKDKNKDETGQNRARE